MCKEGDEEKPKEPVAVIIPEGLPTKSAPIGIPNDIIQPPEHRIEAPSSSNPEGMSNFEDLPLSDVNEETKAR